MTGFGRYRHTLPQLDDRLFLTDGGIETTLIFHDGLDLPDFAAFPLLRSLEGEAALRTYFQTYAAIARRFGVGLVLETPTWRASADWGTKLGYGPADLQILNRQAVRLLEEIQLEYDSARTPVVISGCLGPRGDGYMPGHLMSSVDAARYHRAQIDAFATTSADLVTALTMNYTEEAVGLAKAAQSAQMPVVVSFTVETDGRLPSGQALAAAVEQVDRETARYPSYYMINCAHPTHFEAALASQPILMERLRGLRANASTKSHAELNESTSLDFGDPKRLGQQYADLKRQLANLCVLGGCCGTDHRHIEQIAAACAPLFPASGP